MGKSSLSLRDFTSLRHYLLETVLQHRAVLSETRRDGELAAPEMVWVFYLAQIFDDTVAFRQLRVNPNISNIH